jgi:hypothetical protein
MLLGSRMKGTMENPVHIDGVYAYFDGFGIELRLGNHEAKCAVYLEPEVLRNLIEWRDKIQRGDEQ